MIFRVVLVTLFLGGTIAVDVETLASLSDPRNVALVALIIVTYVLTIGYAVSLRRLEDLVGLTRFQIVADFAITALLVLFTNGLDSLFIFLFYLNIINTAVVAGRRPAMYAAGATAAIMFGLGVLTAVGTQHPLLQLDRSDAAFAPVYFEVLVNSVAAFLIAYLAGRLTARLGETTLELEQKRDDLAELRALTQNILASLNSGLVTIDEKGKTIYLNRAASAITGLDRDEVLGAPFASCFPKIDRVLQSRGTQAAESGPSGTPGEAANPRFECEYTRPDGETIFLGYSISVLRNSEGEAIGHIVVFQDLTEVKRLEAAQKRSQKLAAVGELAASIAHEIRNPLASISGSVEMLESTADLGAQEESLMQIILREVDRLDTLISEFLDYSRPSSISFDATDLEELVEEVVRLFNRRDATEAGRAELQVDGEREEWTAEIDRESIRQVLWNLLNNAADALADPPEQSPAIEVRLGTDKHDGETYFTITVEDAGPGIPEEERERIFEPFFTTKNDGSGLGLATSHRLVDEHDGQIQLGDSDELGGAKFVIWLPDSRHSTPPDDDPPSETSNELPAIEAPNYEMSLFESS